MMGFKKSVWIICFLLSIGFISAGFGYNIVENPQGVSITINEDGAGGAGNLSATDPPYLYDDGSTVYFNETKLNATIASESASVSDTNESTRFANLVTTDCGGTDKVVGVQANGTVLCSAVAGGGDFSFTDFEASWLINNSAWETKVNASYLDRSNSTYESYASNVSRNYTEDTYNAYNSIWSLGGGNFYFQNFTTAFDSNFSVYGLVQNSSYLSTANSTYESYATNVSTNWTQVTFDTYNSTWDNRALTGDFSFTDFFSSFLTNISYWETLVNDTYLSTANSTYESYASNVSRNYTEDTYNAYNSIWSVGGGNFYFQNFTTAFDNNASGRWSDFNSTDFSTSFDNNLSTSLPLENKTLVSCSNITGATSDLCTLTAGSGGNFYFQNFSESWNLNNSAWETKVNSSYLSTANSTYESYADNVSNNWTEEVFNAYNSTWDNRASTGDFSFTDFQSSFDLNNSDVQSKVNSSYLDRSNSTYESYASNVSRNYTEDTYNAYNSIWSVGGGNFYFQNFSTSWNLNNSAWESKVNASYLDRSNITYENYATNVSKNWTEEVFNTYNGTWDNRASTGDFSFTDFSGSFAINFTSAFDTNISGRWSDFNQTNFQSSFSTNISAENVARTNNSNTFSEVQYFNNIINITNGTVGGCSEYWNGSCSIKSCPTTTFIQC